LDAVQSAVLPVIHRNLGTLNRIHPLPAELPCLGEDYKSMNAIVKLAKQVANNNSYWESAPSHFPLAEDEINSLQKIAVNSRVSSERVERIFNEIREKGMDKVLMRENLRQCLKTFATGEFWS